MNEPLNETERQELERLREACKPRAFNRSLVQAQNLASFIWYNGPGTRFEGNVAALWKALPPETQEQLLEFIETPKKGPKKDVG